MAEFFNEILNISINSSWMILAVLLIRLIFSKAPKWIRCLLWTMVGIRLIFPFSIESAMSLLPSAQPIPSEILHDNSTVSVSGAEVFRYIGNNPVSYSLGYADGSIHFNEYCTPDVDTVNPLFLFLSVAFVIWLIGFVALLIYAVISYIKLKSKIETAVLLRDNIYQSEAVASPFILGIIKPKIYIPYGLSEETLQYVEAHENTHLKRLDHITKPLGFLILCVHWFNPIVWVAYTFFCKDIELACDESVIRNMKAEKRKEYASAILECGINGRKIAAYPLAFGEANIKERIKNALSYKKPMLWLIVIAIIVCSGVAIGFMTNPDSEKENPSNTFTATDNGSSREGVRMTVTDLKLDSDDPTITVEWSNKLENTVLFGAQFDILYYENGKWISCLKPDTDNITHLLLYMLNPDSKKEMVYHINNFDLSRSGKYRVTATYELDIYQDMSLSRVLFAYAGFELSEAVTPGETNPFPEVESVTANNEFVGIQAESIPFYDAILEKYLIPDGYDDIPIYAGASNRDKLYYSNILHLPTYGIKNTDELEAYKRNTVGGTKHTDTTALNKYDEVFFDDNMLILINSSSESNEHFSYNLIGVYSSGSDVWVMLEKTHPKEYSYDDNPYGANIIIEVKKEDIPKAQTFDAWIERDFLADDSVSTDNN